MQRIQLALTPILFLILWSSGYVVAKVALLDAAPMALLALRFAAVITIMGVLFIILRPPLPKTKMDWLPQDGAERQSTGYNGWAWQSP